MPSSKVVLNAVAHGQLRLKDLAAALDAPPQRVRQLVEQEGFPEPVAIVGRSRLWDPSDVEAWTTRVKWWSKRWRESG